MYADAAFNISFQPRGARRRAAAAFENAYWRGLLDRFWAKLTGHAHRLLTLPARLGEQHFIGAQAVAVDRIRGTENRSDDFDADFHPLTLTSRDRWVSVFTAWSKGAALPPVELVKVRDAYFVRDGHHRISVARALGRDYVDAIVVEA